MQSNRVELLAPAGNAEGFYGAIHAGADAVYLGGSRFGARAYAENFTTEELVNGIRYAHIWGRKVYLTVNTLVKECEFADIYDYLLPYYEAGLDGVIVQDIGAFVFIRDHFPEFELHVSTQMTLTGKYGAAMLRDMGACRIVPARELSLGEIIRIKEQTGLAIETFIHGAMCYCYSGQCLFSSILGQRSGNRGRCAQPCRLPYEVETAKYRFGECYPLSLKDMCTIEHIPEFILAGIDSFKIEGRMKKPEYTAGVTAVYRKYIDSFYKNPPTQTGQSACGKIYPKMKVDPADLKELSCLYIRSERQDGYYYKHNGRDMVTLTSPAYSGSDEALLARIRRDYLEQKPKLSVAVYADFRTGSKASVTFVSEDLSVTAVGDTVQTASRQPITKENIAKQLSKLGDSCFTADTMEILADNDAFYPLRAMNELRREAVWRLECAFIEKNGFAVCRRKAVSLDGDFHSLVSSREEKSIQEDSAVLKDKIIPEDKAIQNDKNIRKNKDISRDRNIQKYNVPESHNAVGGRIFLSIRTEEQLQAVSDMVCSGTDIARIYLDSNLFTEDVLLQCSRLGKYTELVISLPYIAREKDYPFIEDNLFSLLTERQDIFRGVQLRNLEEMGMLWNNGYQGRVYTDAGFYIWNLETLRQWADSVTAFCLPWELKGTEQKSLCGNGIPCEKVVYGRIPMMITANCVANSVKNCLKSTGERIVWLTDRYHIKFPVELNCTQCMNIIYNSVPLSLHGELDKWCGQADFRLDFTIEGERELKRVVEYFSKLRSAGYSDRTIKPPYQDYTTGHEKRGVE